MYDKCCCEEHHRGSVHKDSVLAFGMGIDAPDVRQVIHWGVSDDREMYVHRSGRKRWDGILCSNFLWQSQQEICFPNYDRNCRSKDQYFVC